MRSNRGVAGIDGTVSTAIGAALAHDTTGGRTVALIGDLTFVHDSSGLLIGPTEPVPADLTIVVSNDNGGGIFELLEQGDPRFSDVSSRVFGTPHDVDVGALCRAYHVDSRQIEVDDLGAALDEPAPGCGCWRSRPTGRRCGSCTPPSRPHCDAIWPAALHASLKTWARILIHGRSGELPNTRGHHVGALGADQGADRRRAGHAAVAVAGGRRGAQ